MFQGQTKTVIGDYTPRPKQALFHKSSATECLFGGAKSPGKSCALTMEAVAYALQYPGTKPYLFRSTFDDLDANLIHNGSTIKFRYIRNLVDAYRYNGRSIPWIGVDELTEHTEQAIQILLSCNRTADRVPVRFRATANPGNKGHKWVCARYVTPTDHGNKTYNDPITGNLIQFIPATVYDGVLVERDPAYVKRLENLPETEKQAYLYGNWDIFEGQFFSGDFGLHNKEAPFEIPEQVGTDRIIGSLDHGIAHYTSFGLAYLSPDGAMHRFFTYKANGGTTRGHAEAIVDAIESCRYSRHMYPSEIYYDYAMDTRHALNESNFRCDLDEYRDAFASRMEGKATQFIPANKRKVDGCHAMRQVFNGGNGVPLFRYFDGLNDDFVEGINDVLTDKLNPEMYAKMDGDDVADECRYLVMGALRKQESLKMATRKAVQDVLASPGYRSVSDFSMFNQ
jgi:hypothetical protein